MAPVRPPAMLVAWHRRCAGQLLERRGKRGRWIPLDTRCAWPPSPPHRCACEARATFAVVSLFYLVSLRRRSASRWASVHDAGALG